MSEITVMTVPLKFVNHSIEDFAMQVTFDPVSGEGNVVYNLSLIKNEDLDFAISTLKDAYKTGVTVSGRVRFFSSGEKIAGYTVPKGLTGICTICSITFDGLLIRRGIPITPIGGGIVEIEKRTPMRFTHIILYEHTTIDPLQVLFSQKTTSITSVMRTGSGAILANIREFHMEAEHQVGTVLDELSSSSLTGILEAGYAEPASAWCSRQSAVRCNGSCRWHKSDGCNTRGWSLGADSGNEGNDGNITDGRDQGLLKKSFFIRFFWPSRRSGYNIAQRNGRILRILKTVQLHLPHPRPR